MEKPVSEQASGAPQALHYTLTRDDLYVCAFRTGRLDWPTKAAVTGLFAVAGLAVAALPQDFAPLLWWVLAGSILLATALASILYSTFAMRRRARLIKEPVGSVTLYSGDMELIEKSTKGMREIPFAKIDKLFSGPNHLFLMTGDRPVIIPRSAFPDGDGMMRFGEKLIEAINRAKTV